MISEIVISVVIPCYNAEETIQKAIESIILQTKSVYEIIVVDDGSKDNTLEILSKLKKEWKSQVNLEVFVQKNSGPSVARNKGIIAAKGSWIAFLDSDDYWDKNKIELQEVFLNKNKDIDLIGCADLQDNIQSQIISFEKLLYSNKFQTSAVLVRKEVILDFLFDENQKYSEDYRSWLLIALNHKMALIKPRMAFSIEDKIAYGGSGLASKLKEMEKGELSNYKLLYKKGYIGFSAYLKCTIISLLKYIKRVFVVKLLKK